MKKLLVCATLLTVALGCGDRGGPTSITPTDPGKPLFDDISNDLDLTIDATLEEFSLVVGATGTTQLYVEETGTGSDPIDGKSGCNLNKGSLVVSVSSSDATVVTVSPSSLTFVSCGDVKELTITALKVGSATISLGQTSNTSSGTFELAPASFEVTVTAPAVVDVTAPTITPLVTGTLGSNPWYTSDVTVSWTVSDGESAITSQTGCGPTSITTDTPGQTLTCSATSAGGTATQSVTIKRDATAPTITGSASPAANGSGWNNTDVTVSFACSDATSGIASCTADETLGEGAGQSTTGTAADNAGNTSSTTVSGINIDKTEPTASAAASPAPNGHGWNNSAVTVSFSGTDFLSGIDVCAAAVVLSGEGADQSASGTCTDKAGNVSAVVTATVDIDLTEPMVSLVGGPANGGSYYFGSVPAAPTCTASDALSGLDGTCVVTGHGTTVGTHTVTATATDKAGNTSTASATYTVLAWTLSGFFQPVDMGANVWNTVKGGSTVPLKFRVFAGPTELTDVATVKSFVAAQVSCSSGNEDAVEELATTGGTSLRYDAVAGQFVQNWATPKLPGKCYRVTMTTQDGSKLEAFFKLK